MAVETEAEFRARLAKNAPGARVTSAYRTPEHNEAVGGVENSFHTRGAPGAAQGLDVVPGDSGLTMAELSQRMHGPGVVENINEGDHVHFGIDGKPSVDPTGGSGREQLAPGSPMSRDWFSNQGIDPDRYQSDPAYAEASMRGLGFQPINGQWVRGDAPEPLDNVYAARVEQRESAALDQEEEGIRLLNTAQSIDGPEVAQSLFPAFRDIGQGVFLEGGQAVVSGVKRGWNATMDLVDEAGDWIEQYVPGTVMWEGFDGDATTPARIYLTTQDKAQARMEELQGAPLTVPQRIASGDLRVGTSEAERPESVTGRVIEGVTQFTTGFVGGGRVLRGWQTAGRAAQIGKSLVQGALADFTAFDGQEARLSNLLAEYAPDALAPALDWLAADPNDGEIEGRFKNAIEGTFLGGAADVLGVGIRRLRAARETRSAAREAARAEGLQVDPTLPMTEAATRGEEVQTAVQAALGNPNAPRVRVRPDTEAPVITPFQTKVDAADANTAGLTPADVTASTDNVFDINLARIDAPEDVQAVITGMADKLRADVNLARRATRSWDETRAASGQVDWVESMAARQPGGAVNAETALAYRLALNSSATKLLELARKVEAEPTLANQYAFRRATASHAAIQNELMGARAEAGRALNAFKIPAGAPATYLRQMDSLIADAGGANSAQELARRMLDAAKNGDVALNEMVRGGALGRTKEIIKLVYTNSLLSGVGTPLINTLGNGLMLGLNLATRSVSPRMARAFGGQASTQVGEASALLHGYQQAIRDMFRLNPVQAAQRIGENAGEALRRDGLFRGMAPGLDDAAPDGVRLRAEREEAGSATSRPLSAAAWRVKEDSRLGRVMDIFQMLAEAPSNLNALTDDAFKTIAARGELHAQAFRRVSSEGLEGEAARTRYAELMQNPTDDMLEAAEREMHDLTFTRETPGIAKAFTDLRRAMDDNPTPIPFGTITLPFLRTPANLVSVGMRYSPLAPFSRRFRDALAEGGSAAENAKASLAVGTAMWSVWIGMAMDGDLTGAGPGNRGQREAMQRVDEFGGTVFQPYSVRVGDRWMSFERADPLGQGMGLVADMADLLKNGDWDSERNGELDEVVAHAVMAMGKAFFDKTMLRSATELTSALLDGTTADAERLLMQRASGAVPGSSGLRMIRRGEDPYLRETHNVVTAIMNTVPGLSDNLPVQRDLWGRPRTYQTGLGTVYDAITPVQTRAAGGSAIDLEILNNGVSVTMPGRNINVMGETVSLKNRPDIYSDYLQLAGEPAFEQLTAVVEGRHPDSEYYLSLSDGPDGGKAEYIKDVITAYRRDARAMILDRYASDLQGMAGERIRRREESRAVE